MSKVWEIIESNRSGKSHEDDVRKAYECGYEEGFEDAMMQSSAHMGERSYRINDQYTGRDPGRSEESMSRRGGMNHRESMRYRMEEQMGERRMRDSQGRYR